jgi:hypothetical protein
MLVVDFWARVKKAIIAEKTTLEWVAGYSGINTGTIKQKIHHKRLPDISQGVLIAKALHTTAEALVSGELSSGISPDALRLARDYDRLDEEGQDNVRGNMAGMLATHRKAELQTKKAASE